MSHNVPDWAVDQLRDSGWMSPDEAAEQVGGAFEAAFHEAEDTEEVETQFALSADTSEIAALGHRHGQRVAADIKACIRALTRADAQAALLRRDAQVVDDTWKTIFCEKHLEAMHEVASSGASFVISCPSCNLERRDAEQRLEEVERNHLEWERLEDRLPTHKARQMPQHCVICKRISELEYITALKAQVKP